MPISSSTVSECSVGVRYHYVCVPPFLGMWSVKQLLGPPTVYPAYGDINGVWAAATTSGGTEWVELGFEAPMYVYGIEVYETFRPVGSSTL